MGCYGTPSCSTDSAPAVAHAGLDEAAADSAASSGAWDDDTGRNPDSELPDIVELRREEAVRFLPSLLRPLQPTQSMYLDSDLVSSCADVAGKCWYACLGYISSTSSWDPIFFQEGHLHI